MPKLLKRLPIIAITLIVVGMVAYQMSPPSAEGREAVVQLAKVDTFSFGSAGDGAQMAEREKWFLAIFTSRHASLLFRNLFEKGTTEGKVYALVGLHLTDKRGFDQLAPRFAKESSRVHTQGGCLVDDCSAAEAVTAIERGEVEKYVQKGVIHRKATTIYEPAND